MQVAVDILLVLITVMSGKNYAPSFIFNSTPIYNRLKIFQRIEMNKNYDYK